MEPGPRRDGIKKCWDVGAVILQQLSEQESGSDEDSEGEDDEDEDGDDGDDE